MKNLSIEDLQRKWSVIWKLPYLDIPLQDLINPNLYRKHKSHKRLLRLSLWLEIRNVINASNHEKLNS
jgi:hypothetical protein